jgi:hypothetical protein
VERPPTCRGWCTRTNERPAHVGPIGLIDQMSFASAENTILPVRDRMAIGADEGRGEGLLLDGATAIAELRLFASFAAHGVEHDASIAIAPITMNFRTPLAYTRTRPMVPSHTEPAMSQVWTCLLVLLGDSARYLVEQPNRRRRCPLTVQERDKSG